MYVFLGSRCFACDFFPISGEKKWDENNAAGSKIMILLKGESGAMFGYHAIPY